MPLDNFIKELIAATPNRRVEGKKRLQKLVFLLDDAGFDSGATFFLKDYGPFSREVENAADMMSIFGEILEKNVTTGYSNYIATAYALPEGETVYPDDNLRSIVEFLEKFRSVELEVASTIRFFENEGLSFTDAVAATKEIKPSKSTNRVLDSAKQVLNYISDKNVSASHT